jgi:uncharacterized membrane protein YbhN (UPF0104 family)/tRNA A-37 threonylcarbamoyl transferase component Bud32
VRRTRDALRIVFGALLVAVLAANAVRRGALQQAIMDALDALPGWVEVTFWVGYGLGGIYAVGVLVMMTIRVRRNPGAARDVALAVAAAVVMGLLLLRWREGLWLTVGPEFGTEIPEPLFPIVRVALVTAAVMAASPHVTRPLRRFGALMVGLVAVSGSGLGFGFPTDAIAAIGIGMIASGAILLLFGSPEGFPETAVIVSALRQLDVEVYDLEPASDQSWGTRRLLGTGEDGTVIEVKAYGRDAADTQVASRAWRSLMYRDAGPAPPLTRVQAVEHEALMMLFAGRAGVRAAEPLTAGLAGDDVAILAAALPGVALSAIPPDEIPDEALVEVWRDIGLLHDADLMHGSLRCEAIRLVDGGHLLHDFERASLAAGDRRHLDTIEFLFSLGAHVGADRAVAAARAGLGPERLAAALPYFQLPAISRAGRRPVPKPKALLAELTGTVAATTDIEPPEPVKLRRVSVRSLLMAALMLFAANALISQLAGIDYAAVWDVVKDASWLGLVVAFAAAHVTFVPEARSMMAAVGIPLPMQPLVLLQISTRFIGFAVPSAAGRVAMMTAFLVKYGVTRARAITQGAIDGFSGFLVEAAILLLALILSDQSYELGGDIELQAILLIVVGLVVLGAAVVVVVEKVRRLVLPVVKDAFGAVRSVVSDPKTAIALLANNFLARLTLGVTLWIILRSLGVGDISISVALTVTVATNLLAGLAPVPGGIGVAEAVLTSWLILVGVPEAPAFAATVVYRMVTFYLPAVEGFFTMRSLERGGYL